jgi:hypothetical protein
VFNIADRAPVTIDWAVRGLLASAGVPARPAYVPAGLLSPLACVFPRGRLNRYVISQFAVERTLDLTAAIDRLGFEPVPTVFPPPFPPPCGVAGAALGFRRTCHETGVSTRGCRRWSGSGSSPPG